MKARNGEIQGSVKVTSKPAEFNHLWRNHQSPYLFYRHPMHVGILMGAVIFQAAQIFYSPGIVFTMNSLDLIFETKHKIYLAVCHAQHIKIGFGGGIALVLQRIEFCGSFLKVLDFPPVACLGNIHHQHLIAGRKQNRSEN